MNLINIKQPKWSTHEVLIADYKVGEQNIIEFTEAPSLLGKVYHISGATIRRYPLKSNGKIPVYYVPMSELREMDSDE